MSSHVTLRCDTAKCGASFTGGTHATELFVRASAQSQQGWTTTKHEGQVQTWFYDYCKEHSPK